MSTAATTAFSVAIPPSTQKVAGGAMIAGGVATSVLAAKSIIVLGFGAQAIPIIGTIIGIMMAILGACLLYHAYQRETSNPLPSENSAPPAPQAKVEDLFATEPEPNIRKLLVQESSAPPEMDLSSIETPAASPSEEDSIAPPTEQEVSEKLSLSNSDKLLTATNAFQWGLIGAALWGVAPAITVPLGLAASVGSEVATYCMLPEDASLIRKAMTFPIIPKAILNSVPYVGKISQAYSLYSLAQSSSAKLSNAWSAFKSDPINAAKTGAVHLFNLASGVAFAANSAGLINLNPTPKDGPCDPLREKECSGPINRTVRLASVYDNNGNKQRQSLSDRTTENHREYAKHWGLEHDVSSENLVGGQCKNPYNGNAADCSPYWNKIKYFKNWCDKPGTPGTEEWAIYADDDAVYSNFQINPLDAIDALRGNKDTSFVIATEGKGTRHNPGAVNTGVMIVRKDPRGCEVIEKIWKNRDFVTDENNPKCPTYGLCKGQGNGDEQGATDKVFWRDATRLIGRDVTRVLARDATHPTRGHIAFNTVNRGGCFTHLQPDGRLGDAFSITSYDQRENPDGVWKEGDWIGQTAGYPLYGQDLAHQPDDNCTADPTIPIEPIRLKRVNKMFEAAERTLTAPQQPRLNTRDPSNSDASQTYEPKIPLTCAKRDYIPFRSDPVRREITFGAVYDNAKDPKRDKISDFVNENHGEYAHKWGMKHKVVSGNLLKGKCTNPVTKAPADCSAYWNKIQMLREWLNEPKKPGVDEEWRYYADDDMLVMNLTKDPSKAIDDLRGNDDTSIIIAEDVIDWQRWLFDEEIPHVAVNTGAIIVRKDERARAFIEDVWNRRHTRVLKGGEDCPNIGMCKSQDLSMQEQEAFTLALRENPNVVGEIVTVIPPRDSASKTRATLAMNTFYRHGCFTKKKEGVDKAFIFEGMDKEENPQGAFQKGDWLVQPAGVPVWGKDLPLTRYGNCIDDPKVSEGPARLNRLKELATHIVR